MDGSRSRPSDQLGINKMSKGIRKSPLHQPNFANPQQQQQQGAGGAGNQPTQPQVYNINKSDFRSIVQQLTGTPTRDPSPASNRPPLARAPALNAPKPPSTRLHKIRPPPLTSIARPPISHPTPQQFHLVNLNPNLYIRPVAAPAVVPAQAPAVPFSPLLPPTQPPGTALWANTLESPISAYMRFLESSILQPDVSHQAAQHTQQRAYPGQMQQMPPPVQASPHAPPRPQQSQAQVARPPASSTDMFLNPHAAPFLSPRNMGPPTATPPCLLPSPTSQFVLPSPSAFLNLLSPRSPFPLFSPRLPITPNYEFSPMGGQSGILGLGPRPPPSPGLLFPPSPPGFLPIMSPRWRDL